MLQIQGAMASIPGQGTRSHMLQVRVCMPQLRPGTTNKYKIKKKKRTWEREDDFVTYIMTLCLYYIMKHH